MGDDWLDELLKDTRIVRNGARIQSVQRNAVFILEEMENHGSFGVFLSGHGPHDFATLMMTLHKKGDRLGDKTAQYFLREAGVDAYVLTFDVIKRLSLEGIADKVPSSKMQRQKVQDAFDIWVDQSGKNLTYVSRVLAMSVNSDKVVKYQV
jgi:3-methyladenine DNA glycosylase Tag